MASAYTRRKQPELVRRELLERAIEQAAEHGLGGLSLGQVAAAAGVTKGGLLHHFPNKRALIDAVFEFLMREYSDALAQRMARDPEPYGRFTRAYLDSSFVEPGELDEWSALWRSVLTDPQLSLQWASWLEAQLASRGPLEEGPALEAVRFAADGLWAGLFSGIHPADPDALRAHLRSLTSPPATTGTGIA